MTEATNLTKGIHTSDKKSSYDEACKRVLSEKRILAWIMKSCMKEYRESEIDEIAERYIEGTPSIETIPIGIDESGAIRGINSEDTSLYEGVVRYDILYTATIPGSDEMVGLIINIEAQNDFHPGYPIPKRGMYHCARMVSSQKGREFFHSDYDKIKKVYSVWVCMNPPNYRKNTINEFHVTETCVVGEATYDMESYDLMATVVICLGGEGENRYTGILKLLDVLLDNNKEPKEKKTVLEEEYKIPLTHHLEKEVDGMCNLSKGVEEKGIKKGIQKGILGSIANVMKNKDWTEEEAMSALGVPESEWESYSEKLKLIEKVSA
jgi:hypothetical protein